MSSADPAPAERGDLAGLAGDIERLEEIFAGWDERHRDAVAAYRRALDALHRAALERLIRALKRDPAALAAMKAAVGDEIVYAVLRHHELVKPSINERVEAALAGIRPILAAHGGNVELVRVEPPAVEVRLIGACDGCASAALTLQAGIRKAVADAVPELTEIVHVDAAPPAARP